LVTLLSGKKPVGCMQVDLYGKIESSWTIERYKAKLAAQGFTQTWSDYLETFAQVAKMNTVKVILSLAANHDYNLI